MKELEITEKKKVTTPFGDPSAEFVLGKLSGREVVFLARHGQGHRLTPSEVNYRANIWGLKSLGVRQILSVSAVGSLKEEIEPGQLVFVDQFIDRTYKRISTFFGEGVVAHVTLADPVCSDLRKAFLPIAKKLDIPHRVQGTYVCMEGPQFSTKAESNIYRSWNADVIGMTNVTEAKLAREAQLCYATIALATDYDCWHPHHDSVTVEQVIQTLLANVEKARRFLVALIQELAVERHCACCSALKNAIITDEKMIAEETKKRLDFLRSH
ncbi:MAG: S-methyl-5'-thioadenosine phosphorylase [Deltaproteobacteria bacterium]|nr:S-methyl-5'-thioadenosine phosphorylase [Deltaproteobacteria bacterium]